MSPALTLFPYQQRWLADRSRFKIGMFARQTGKTFTTTLEIALDCFAAEAAGRRARWVILSRGERQAREAIETLKLHARAIAGAAAALGGGAAEEAVDARALEVIWPGGSRVSALPANPDTARGFSANVFLDEFAFHLDSAAIWRALYPVISAGWRLVVTSTPNGKSNKFYELMEGADPVWSRHRVDIAQAVAEGLPRDIEELRAGLNDPDAWAQEYELRWLDEATAWLPYGLIDGVEHESAGLPDQYGGAPCYLGNDIGRVKDLWVAWVLEPVGDVLWTREISILKGASFAEQDSEFDRLMRQYRVARAAIDQTGLGQKPVEDAIRRWGARVTGVTFTAATKLLMATRAKAAFEARTLRIPAGDPALRQDLHRLRRLVGPTGTPRFVVEGGGDSHADRAWALFLALEAAEPGGDQGLFEYYRGEIAT